MCLREQHKIRNARVAQLVERDLAKVEAAGSSPVSRSEEKNSSSERMGYFFVRTPWPVLERFEVSPAGSVGAKRSPPESSAPSRASMRRLKKSRPATSS